MADAIVANATDGSDDILPPHLFTGAGIAERALRKVGAFTVNDTGTNPEELAEALYWLDLIVAELSGTQECFWLRDETVTVPLVADQTDPYVLADVDGFPRQGAVFVLGAWLRDPNDQDTPIEILRRNQYEELAKKDTSGQPYSVYVDRLVPSPSMLTYPVIADDDYSVRLLVQSYHPSLSGTLGDEAPKGAVALRIGAAFQRFLVFALAADIGDGPVRRIEDNKVTSWRKSAAMSLTALNGYINREKPRQIRTRRHDGVVSMVRRDPYTTRRFRGY